MTFVFRTAMVDVNSKKLPTSTFWIFFLFVMYISKSFTTPNLIENVYSINSIWLWTTLNVIMTSSHTYLKIRYLLTPLIQGIRSFSNPLIKKIPQLNILFSWRSNKNCCSFCIKSPIFSKTKRRAPISESTAKKVLRGILAFDFSAHVPNIFIIGTEGGLVIQCNTLGAQPLKGTYTNFTNRLCSILLSR